LFQIRVGSHFGADLHPGVCSCPRQRGGSETEKKFDGAPSISSPRQLNYRVDRILLAPNRLTDTVRNGARRVHAPYSDENCHEQRSRSFVSACCTHHPSNILLARTKIGADADSRRQYHHRWSFEGTFDRWLKERGAPTCLCMAGKFPGGSPTE
jgi:hypothetical protein